MAAPTNVVSTFTQKGNREDLENVIYRVSASKTPFINAIGDVKASAVTHEWQTEDLDAVNTANAQVEGDDATIDTGNTTTRVGNIVQIFRKTGAVTGTQEAVTSAGRSSDYNRQVVIKGKSMMRDMEATLLANQASAAGSSTVAKKLGGALAWLTSNTNKGTGGADGGASGSTVTAATNGTQRAFTEALLKSTLAQAFSNGAEPTVMLMGAALKQEAAAFTGLAQQRRETGNKQATIVAGADVYVSDFGEISFVPHQFALSRDALIIDPDQWAVATLRSVKTEELAKTGDSDKFQIICEKTLVCRNEKGSAVIRDLQ